MGLRAIFFDAGNTLVFADLDRILAPLAARGIHPTQQQLHAAERAAKRRLDDTHLHGDHSVDRRFWNLYYDQLLESLGCPDSDLCDALVGATRRSDHWNRVLPGTREVLERLSRRYRLGVISNSDGGIADLLRDLGLRDFFESVTDSSRVGFEKPDPRIFQAALQSLGSAAEESVYVGDVYSLDYLGAKNAGLDAILVDVAGTYQETDLPRVASLSDLESHLNR